MPKPARAQAKGLHSRSLQGLLCPSLSRAPELELADCRMGPPSPAP
jgi:hypothetical protein